MTLLQLPNKNLPIVKSLTPLRLWSNSQVTVFQGRIVMKFLKKHSQ